MVLVIEDLPSIYELAPFEQGGPIARTGFLYQDHIAARFCIEMLRNPDLMEVWCESLDDITLIWSDNGAAKVEFVQVKAGDIGQMWSISRICEGGAASLVGRSLAQHRCSEPCCFRVVTRLGIHSDLHMLCLALDHPQRCIGNAGTLSLHEVIGKTLDEIHSPAGWSPSNWLQHTLWDIAESETAVEDGNLLKLDGWLEEIGEPLFSDQRAELYNRILGRILRASAKLHHAAPDKKLKRAAYQDWVSSEVHRIAGQAPTKSGQNLTAKMTSAMIPDSAVQNALRLRLAYRSRMLGPKYQQEDDYKFADLEVTAVLQQLVALLDAGLVQATGPAFHAQCLNAIANIRQGFTNVDLSFLQGSMYSMTDRCRHRFLPAVLP